MKKIVFLLLLSVFANAEMVTFECRGADQVSQSDFDGVGEFSVEGKLTEQAKEARGSIAVVTRDAGNEGTLSPVVSLNTSGNARVMTGVSNQDAVFAEFVKEINGNQIHFSLLLDYAKNLESRINNRTTGKSYRADCYTITRF